MPPLDVAIIAQVEKIFYAQNATATIEHNLKTTEEQIKQTRAEIAILETIIHRLDPPADPYTSPRYYTPEAIREREAMDRQDFMQVLIDKAEEIKEAKSIVDHKTHIDLTEALDRNPECSWNNVYSSLYHAKHDQIFKKLDENKPKTILS